MKDREIRIRTKQQDFLAVDSGKLSSAVKSRSTFDDQTAHTLLWTLRAQGVKVEIAQKLIDGISIDRSTNCDAEKFLTRSLGKLLKVDCKLPTQKKVVALIGATGVGKTTTIAKLAAQMQLVFGMKVGLISTDSFRVGAGTHLRTYASIMNLPYRMVKKAGALDRAIRALDDNDLILIDTAGYSYRDQSGLKNLETNLDSSYPIEKIMVLPAVANSLDLRKSMEAFSKLDFERVIVSKLDETGLAGPIVNLAVQLAKPFCFFTFGQRVPEDIEPANGRRLARMLLRGFH